MSPQTFFSHPLLLANIFFHFFFSVFCFFGLNIVIALLNDYISKNAINSVIANYFVDIHSTHLSLYCLVPWLSMVKERKGAKLLVGSGCQHTKTFQGQFF